MIREIINYACKLAAVALLGSVGLPGYGQSRPNIIFVMVDDVGYGDIGRHGSPIIRTPNLDRLYDESVRLVNYHSGTTCSPTRAGIMTGRHYNKVGVWHTIIGRSLLRPDVVTLPEILSESGYSSAIFGKWHLGDNYPMRPQDRGFGYTLIHGGGGVGQTPDYWGNDYFDDTYWRNGQPEKFNGYCTDVWFGEAIQFIRRSVQNAQPFFCYLSLNAAHQPHRAPQHSIDKYKNIPEAIDPVYNAMVDNIDENMGLLMEALEGFGIADNTILIFTSDNGTSPRAGVLIDKEGFVTKGYNAGMRGVKSMAYEGGHRVPFFVRYPAQGINTGTDVVHLSSCLDVLPTLLSFANISTTPPEMDGEDISPYLKGKPADTAKIYIADTQRDRFLLKYKEYSVMQSSWRYTNGQLFDLTTDPEQRTDISQQHPVRVAAMKQAYENWWAAVEKENAQHPFVRIPIQTAGTTEINCMDLFPDNDQYTAWHQDMIKSERNNASGVWKLQLERSGKYRVEIRQFPREAEDASLPVFDAPGLAFLQVNDGRRRVIDGIHAKKAGWKIKLKKGDIDFTAGFQDADGKTIAAQYVYFEKIK